MAATLRESEERFRAMADSSPLIIWIADTDGNTTFINATYASFFGVPKDEIVGGRWTMLLHPESGNYIHAFRLALQDRTLFDARAQVRHADGSWRWLRSIAKPRFGPDQEFLGMVGNSLDITDIVTAEAALRDAARQKDEFLAMLAHELRNPMAPIRNAAELLSRALPADSPLAPVLGMLRRQAQQLARLVDDLLDVSRITQGRIDLKRERMDMNTAVARALETIEPELTQRGHSLQIRSMAPRLWVDADPARMVQVLSNILSNAVKYTEPGGEIHVLSHVSGDDVVVSVADNGIGIAEDMLPKVFDLFVQSDRSLDRSQGGLGIGLSVVKRLVEMHGGRVAVTSGGPGTGTTFEVRLPRQAAPAESEEPTPVGGAARRSLLIIDDNADAAESLAMILNIEGHHADFVTQPRLALDRARLMRPDVILLDLGMPEMDGFEVAHRLRAMPELAKTTIVALTGYGRAEDRELSAAVGFDAHLVKPVDFAALSHVLQEATGREGK
ncbi:MAG: ATP-binding protein [Burkholderiales bacterium]